MANADYDPSSPDEAQSVTTCVRIALSVPTKDHRAAAAASRPLGGSSSSSNVSGSNRPTTLSSSSTPQSTSSSPRRSPAAGQTIPTASTTATSRQLQSSFPGFSSMYYHHGYAGDTVFAGRHSGQVVYWKIPSSARSGVFLEHVVMGSHKGPVTCMAYHPANGSGLILTGSCDYHLKVWDPFGSEMPGMSKCIQTIPAHDATITAIASHCDAVVTTSVDKTLKLWRFETGREKLCFPWLVIAQVCVFDAWVTGVWASPTKQADGTQGEIVTVDAHGDATMFRTLASTSAEAIEEVRIEACEVIRSCPGEKRQTATKVLVIPSLNQFIVLGFEECATVRDLLNLSILLKIPSPDNVRFVDVAWDPMLEELLLLGINGTAHLWSTRKNAFVTSFVAGFNPTSVQLVPSVVGSTKSVFWLSHRDSVDCVQIERTKAFVEHPGHTGRVLGLHVKTFKLETVTSEDDFEVVSASVDNSLCFWNRAVTCVKTRREKVSEISAFCLLHHLPWAVTGHDNGSLKCWSLDRDRSFRFQAHDNTVSSVGEGLHQLRRGEYVECPHLFTTSYDGCLAVWEMPLEGSKAKCAARVRASRSELICSIYDPLSYAYIVGSNEGEIHVFSVNELTPLRSLRSGSQAAVTCLALDANYLYSGGEDGLIRMWNVLAETPPLKEMDFELEPLGDVQQVAVNPESGDVIAVTRTGLLLQMDPTGNRPTRFIKLGKEAASFVLQRRQEKLLCGLEDGSLLTVHLSILQPVQGAAAGSSSSAAAFAGSGFSGADEVQ